MCNQNNAKTEFELYLKKWTIKDNRFLNGVDVGCGTARIDDMIPSIDQQPEYKYAHAQFIWNCHDLELFNDYTLDFIFSSHCLEDFEDIEIVFKNWWRKLRVNGLMLLLLPSMEKCDCQFCKGESRYPRVEQGGNPSHRTNVGKDFIVRLLTLLYERGLIEYKLLQVDTIPHNTSSSVDFVIQKMR